MTHKIRPIAIGYVRVSTADQADSGLSLSAQRRQIEAQAVVSGFDLVDVIADAGASAKNLVRPGVAQLLQRLQRGETDCIIVAKLDRLTRSIRDLGGLLEELALTRRRDGGRGVDLISSTESLDTGSATGRLVINIMASVSQWEREIISERTIAALQEKRIQGRRFSRFAPYGYRYEGDSQVPVESEQAIMLEISELRGQDLSWQRVAQTLNDRGMLNRAGRRWLPGGLWRLKQRSDVA